MRINRAVHGAATASALVAAMVVPAPSASSAPAGFTADAAALKGHGEVAVIANHRLHLIGGAAVRPKLVVLPGQVSRPEWSFDNSILAVAVTKSGRTAIWTVAANGTSTTRLTTPNAGLGSFSWAPNADVLAVLTAQTPSGAGSQLARTITAAGTVTPLASADAITGLSWSPDGQHLALAVDRFHNGWSSKLEVVPAAGGTAKVVAPESGSVFDVARWWPDGSGVLVWQDPKGSASLAADGVHLVDIAVADGQRRRLPGVMLEYPQWLAGSAAGKRVAYIEGGNRELSAGHKHLEVCTSAACRAVVPAAGQFPPDPIFSASGKLVSAADGSHAPGIDRKGDILAVRGGALWLQTAAGSARVAGPVTAPASSYGFRPWSQAYAWTKAITE